MSKYIINNKGNLTEVCLETTHSGLIGVRKIINEGEIITIQKNFQNFVYGDVIVDGVLRGEGDLVIMNGNLIVGNKGSVDLSKVSIIGILEREEYEQFQNKLINDLGNYRNIVYIVNDYADLNNYIGDVIDDDNNKIFITLDTDSIFIIIKIIIHG